MALVQTQPLKNGSALSGQRLDIFADFSFTPSLDAVAACAALRRMLVDPFQAGKGGPGDWLLLERAHLYYPAPIPGPREREGVVDMDYVRCELVGWRRFRLERPDVAPTNMAPDWVLEVDEDEIEERLAAHARAASVRFAWIIDAPNRTVSVRRLVRGRAWDDPERHEGSSRVRLAPFEAAEIDLAALWRD